MCDVANASVGVMVTGDAIARVAPQAAVAVVVATIHPEPYAIPLDPARVRAQLIFLMPQRTLGMELRI